MYLDFLICSDASGPLKTAPSVHHLHKMLKGRLASPRLFDIASDQIRALRSRMFVGAIARGEVQGALLRMGNSVRNLDLKSGGADPTSVYDDFSFETDVEGAANHPADLNALSPTAFDRITRHGYEVTERTLTTYSPTFFNNSTE